MYKVTEMIKNKVYTILIDNWDEEICGVFISEGKDWMLFLDNQNDFLVEGIRFVHKSKIDEIIQEENELFKEKIFAKKYGSLSAEYPYNLDSSEALFHAIMKQQDVLLHFDTDDDEEIVVGILEDVTDKNFKLKSLTSEAQWGESVITEFSEISTVAIENDYLQSLQLVIKD